MPTQNKTPTKKQRTSSKVTSAAKNTKDAKIVNEKSNASKRQIRAIMLFAFAIFLLCIVFIPAEGLWGFLRSFMFGMFGFGAYLAPLVLIYIAIMAALDNTINKIGGKVIESAALIILIGSAIHIFRHTSEVQFWSDLKDAYTAEIPSSGGLLGAFFGGLMLLATGGSKTASGVMVSLLIFVFLMLITGTTLIHLFRSIWKPVKKAGEYTEEKIERSVAHISKNKFNPDVDLGPTPDEVSNVLEEDSVVPVKPTELFKPEKSESKSHKDTTTIKSEPGFDDIVKKAAITATDIPEGLTHTTEKPQNPLSDGDKYRLPPVSCLNKGTSTEAVNFSDELKVNGQKLVDTLKSFGVETKIVDISRGPSVTRYEIQPAAGVKISRITGLADDLALNLAASGVRIEAPIPNKAAVGIEVPNRNRSTVTLREIIDTPQFKTSKSKLNVALGKDIAGNVICADLAKMPHLLIAGTTGSGKSVCLNSMIVSILYSATPDEVKLLMIDPKQVEFTVYNGIPHLLVPVVSDPRKASGALGWAVTEMLQRYKTFAEKNVRDIKGYNQAIKDNPDLKPMPHIVIFIDELSDLMMAAPNEVEDSICRLAQMARAAGMHLVIATQRPSVDVITGIIKANIPSRLSLSVSSQVDSRTIIDMAGAEKLLGLGDMLFYPVGIAKPVRIQGCYLSDKEVEDVVHFIKSQDTESEYDDDVINEIERLAVMEKKKNGGAISNGDDVDESDEMLPKAIEVVVEAQMASTTLLQRKLKLGYARAARIVDDLEARGIVGPYEGSKPRKVLITKQQWLEMNAMASDDATSEE